MQNEPKAIRRLAAGALGALVVTGGILVTGVGALPADAHNYIVSTTPAADSTVTEQPGTISITTNDVLLDVAGGQADVLRIQGPDGYYGDGCTIVDGASASMAGPLGAPGAYTVLWQVVSTDGHPVSGEFTFTWQPDEGQELAEASAEPPVCGQESTSEASPSSDPGPTEEESSPDDGTTQQTPVTDAARDDAAATAVGVVVGIGSALAVLVVAAVVVILVSRRRSTRDAAASGDREDGAPEA